MIAATVVGTPRVEEIMLCMRVTDTGQEGTLAKTRRAHPAGVFGLSPGWVIP